MYKRLGETPRERLERLRTQKPHYEHEVLSYAGRLDPMAEGVLLCLVGSANKRREAYLDMSKEYTLDVLFGFSTDTYDVLGRVMETATPQAFRAKNAKKVSMNSAAVCSAQEYPPYSSKTVEGKSLFEWAREGVIGTFVACQGDATVYHISILSSENMYKVKREPQLLFTLHCRWRRQRSTATSARKR